ncbi:MAG: putative hydrolase [Chlamydiales bacterium]|jgi:ADP-ribose pyrophosphatase YjhB (NUDIX family)|nr:putative hydrolase [Chlamydiales bacterium]
MVQVVVWLILICNGNVLLLKRPTADNQSEFEYSVVGGKLEEQETLTSAVCRETFEEVGVKVEEKDISFVHMIDRYRQNQRYLHCFFMAKKWEGEPFNKEPNKHLEVLWAPLDQLPPSIGPLAKKALTGLHSKELLSQLGWP